MTKLQLRRSFMCPELPTLGMLWLGEEFLCFTLELPWLENYVGTSCIPEGLYEVIPWKHPSKNWVFKLPEVSERAGILIHAGNFEHDSKGCLMVGYGLTRHATEHFMLTESRAALDVLLNRWGRNGGFYLDIVCASY